MSDDDIPPDEDYSPPEAERSGLARHVPEGIRIFPNVWPGEPLKVQPGDVTQFAPMGFCFDAPIMVRPWDTLEGALAAGGYYGAQPQSFHPLYGAPPTEPSGGVLYFDARADSAKILSAIELMHALTLMKDYAVFVSEAERPEKEGFLVHCRMMPFGTVGRLYHASLQLIEGGATPQPMNLGEFILGFIKVHVDRYGTSMCPELYGAMGGDGDWAKEALSFGFMIENGYNGICRLWSRAWLVTK